MESTHSTVQHVGSVGGDVAQPARIRHGTAVSRAQPFLRAGQFRQARDLLARHTLGVEPSLDIAYWRSQIACAAEGGDGSWRVPMASLLALRASCDPQEADHALISHAQYLLESGELDGSEHILASIDPSACVDDQRDVSIVLVKSLLLLRRGHVWEAYGVVQRCCEDAPSDRRPYAVALLSLRRARLLACLGRHEGVTRELLRLQRMSAVLGDPILGQQAALQYAEALLFLGDHDEALIRLKKLAPRFAHSEHQANVAHHQKLLGWALMFEDPEGAIACIEHAISFYTRVGFEYHTMWCHVLLAAARLRRGDPADAVLHMVDQQALARWPMLKSEYVMLCGAFESSVEESLGKRLRRLREWAVGCGYWALTRRLPGPRDAPSLAKHAWPQTMSNDVTSPVNDARDYQGFLSDESVCVVG